MMQRVFEKYLERYHAIVVNGRVAGIAIINDHITDHGVFIVVQPACRGWKRSHGGVAVQSVDIEKKNISG